MWLVLQGASIYFSDKCKILVSAHGADEMSWVDVLHMLSLCKTENHLLFLHNTHALFLQNVLYLLSLGAFWPQNPEMIFYFQQNRFQNPFQIVLLFLAPQVSFLPFPGMRGGRVGLCWLPTMVFTFLLYSVTLASAHLPVGMLSSGILFPVDVWDYSVPVEQSCVCLHEFLYWEMMN